MGEGARSTCANGGTERREETRGFRRWAAPANDCGLLSVRTRCFVRQDTGTLYGYQCLQSIKEGTKQEEKDVGSNRTESFKSRECDGEAFWRRRREEQRSNPIGSCKPHHDHESRRSKETTSVERNRQRPTVSSLSSSPLIDQKKVTTPATPPGHRSSLGTRSYPPPAFFLPNSTS